MAGAGSRFSIAGYPDPKPLIPVHGVPMIKLVIDNLRPARPHRFVFVCQRAHVTDYDLRPKFADWAPGNAIIELDGVTDGAARTVLTTKDLIDTSDELMIANSDQYVDVAIDDYLAAQDERGLDGLIMTMTADDPKWSYALLDNEGLVQRVVEKQVVSTEATVGIYNFREGRMFVAAAKAMIAAREQTNGEYYVAPAYDRMVAAGLRVGVYNIGSDGDGMHGLGTPADLEKFVSMTIARGVQ